MVEYYFPPTWLMFKIVIGDYEWIVITSVKSAPQDHPQQSQMSHECAHKVLDSTRVLTCGFSQRCCYFLLCDNTGYGVGVRCNVSHPPWSEIHRVVRGETHLKWKRGKHFWVLQKRIRAMCEKCILSLTSWIRRLKSPHVSSASLLVLRCKSGFQNI